MNIKGNNSFDFSRFHRMSSSLRQWFARVLVLTQLINGALCWGKEGHYTVCKIAEVKIDSFLRATLRKKL